jgi:hypothetical protein
VRAYQWVGIFDVPAASEGEEERAGLGADAEGYGEEDGEEILP